MGGATKPGPRCTTRGDSIDEGTMTLTFTPTPGPVCIETAPASGPLAKALNEFESEATNFATRFISDHKVRLQYIDAIKKMSDSILDEVSRGVVSAEDGARLANQLRNEILETTRGASSDLGRSWAEKLKAKGMTMAELQEYYAKKFFQREFDALTEAERNEVFLEIIRASGRARPKVLVASARLSKVSTAFLFITVAIAVYQVATSDRPGREAVKQGTVITAGFAGAGLAGAAGGLVCGPGAPICVGIFVFVGGAISSLGADFSFDYLWDSAEGAAQNLPNNPTLRTVGEVVNTIEHADCKGKPVCF